MSSWHIYPKVYALGHAYLKELFLDDVIIQEKVDGSQFSFGSFDGQLRCRSKGREIIIESPEKMFNNAIETIKQLYEVIGLKNNWTYRCEYLQKPKHNTLAYDRIPKGHLIIFDINVEHEDYLSYEETKKEAERLKLEIVPCYKKCKIGSIEDVKDLMETISILGGQKVEGLVFKNYSRFGKDGKALMGKFVSERFKEVHNKSWKERNPNNKDITAILIGVYKTESRWEKAIQHLKERGELTNTPKDIGFLIKEVQQDVKKECEEEIKEKLYKYFISDISRGISGGFPEWYKEKLLENQFE